MIRIAVLTPFWRRDHVSVVYWAGIDRLKRLGKRHNFQLTTCAVVTPGDERNLELAKEARSKIVMAPNEPLAKKWNAGSTALRKLKLDYMLIMGSDDLLSDTMMAGLIEEMRKGTPHHGITDLYLWDAESRQAGYWGGYKAGPRIGGTIGLGRFYSREIMELVDWQLWPNTDESSGMDGLADRRLKTYGVELRGKSCSEWGGVALDIKSCGGNIWSFNSLNRYKIDSTVVRSVFPELSLLM